MGNVEDHVLVGQGECGATFPTLFKAGHFGLNKPL